MADTISTLRAASRGIDHDMLARAAIQYAQGSILTLSGVATDPRIVCEAEKHDGMADLLGTAASILAAARTILHGVSEGDGDQAVVAYRMVEIAMSHIGDVVLATQTFGHAVGLTAAVRDLAALDADPLATVERALGRGFSLKRYVDLLEGDGDIERFLRR